MAKKKKKKAIVQTHTKSKWIDKFSGPQRRTLQKLLNKIHEIFVESKRYGITVGKFSYRNLTYERYEDAVIRFFHYICDVIIVEMIEEKRKGLEEEKIVNKWTEQEFDKKIKKMERDCFKLAHPGYWRAEMFERFIEEKIELNVQGKRGGSAGYLKYLIHGIACFKVFYAFSDQFTGYVKTGSHEEHLDLLEEHSIIRSRKLVHSIVPSAKMTKDIISFIREENYSAYDMVQIEKIESILGLTQEEIQEIKVGDIRKLPQKTKKENVYVYGEIRINEGNKIRSVKFGKSTYQYLEKLCGNRKQNQPLLKPMKTASQYKQVVADVLQMQEYLGLRIQSAFYFKIGDVKLFKEPLYGYFVGYADIRNAKGGKRYRIPMTKKAYEFYLKCIEGRENRTNAFVFEMFDEKGNTLTVRRKCQVVSSLVTLASKKLGFTKRIKKTYTHAKKNGKTVTFERYITTSVTDHSFRKIYANKLFHWVQRFPVEEMRQMVEELVDLQPSPEQIRAHIRNEVKLLNTYARKENAKIKKANIKREKDQSPPLPYKTLHKQIPDSKIHHMYVSLCMAHSRTSIVNFYLA